MELYESQNLRMGELTKKDIKRLENLRKKAIKPIETESAVKIQF